MQMLGFFRSFSESAPEPVTGRSNVQPLFRNNRNFFPTFSESASKLVFEVLESNVWLGIDHAACVEKKIQDGDTSVLDKYGQGN